MQCRFRAHARAHESPEEEQRGQSNARAEVEQASEQLGTEPLPEQQLGKWRTGAE